MRIEIRERGLEQDVIGSRHRVFVEYRQRFLLAQVVGERVVELLGRQWHGAMIVGGIAEGRKADLQSREWKEEDSLHRRRRDGDTRRSQPSVKQNLRDQSTK